MKRYVYAFFAVLTFVSAQTYQGNAQSFSPKPENEAAAMKTTTDQLIAIDVLLEPDHAMIEKSNSTNARLRGNYPAGYALDASHAPHVTMLQRYVRTIPTAMRWTQHMHLISPCCNDSFG